MNDVNAAYGNTTNLLSHLKNYHPEQYKEVTSYTQNDKSQITIEDCILGTKLINPLYTNLIIVGVSVNTELIIA